MMTAAYKYFQSPFLEEIDPPSQVWRPAFPEEEEELPCYTKPDLISKDKQEEDRPEVLTVISFDCQTAKKGKPKEDDLKGILEGLCFESEEAELEDLEGIEDIDTSIVDPPTGPANPNTHDSFSSLFADIQEVEQPFTKLGQGGVGRTLSTKKYEGSQYDEEWVRRLDKVIAARAFVYRGYGINCLKEELRSGNYERYTLDETKYKSISGSMTRETYRKLESFLMRDCQRGLHNLSGYEMKLLQTLLLNCRSTLSQTASGLFLQMVKITYSLKDTSMTEKDASLLYESIYRALQRKINLLRGQTPSEASSDRRRKPHPQPYPHRQEPEAPAADIDREIVRQYIRESSISKLRDALRAKRVLGEAATVKTIRNVLRRVLRSTIRRIEGLLNEAVKDYKDLSKMNDDQIKWLIESAEGIDGRRMLCRLFLQDRDDRKNYEIAYRELRSLLQKRNSLHGIYME